MPKFNRYLCIYRNCEAYFESIRFQNCDSILSILVVISLIENDMKIIIFCSANECTINSTPTNGNYQYGTCNDQQTTDSSCYLVCIHDYTAWTGNVGFLFVPGLCYSCIFWHVKFLSLKLHLFSKYMRRRCFPRKRELWRWRMYRCRDYYGIVYAILRWWI